VAAPLRIAFTRRPSVAAYMLRAFYPPALRRAGPFPALEVEWSGHAPGGRPLDAFHRLTGLPAGDELPLTYPHVLTFPMQMVILTHPSCPLPIWRALQVRNHLQQHRPLPAGVPLDSRARVAGQRVLERGMELDLHLEIRSAGALAWEGLHTYYYRGTFGPHGPPSPLAAAPEETGPAVARWRTDGGGGWSFSGLSGDYNGIHWWSTYARLFGFRGAFHHPHALLGRCLARLALPAAPAQRLDLWLKGPVYYGSQVELRATAGDGGVTFSLGPQETGRACIVGSWRRAGAGRKDGAQTRDRG
jgi:hypothetical protein